METQLHLPKKGAQTAIFGPCLLWSNPLMDQDATWYGGRPHSRPHCAMWGPSSPLPQKGGTAPILGPCLFWPNGWMDQDATWYDGGLRPGQHCVRCGPSSTPKEHSPRFSVDVCCGQMAGWIKMPLDTKVGLGRSYIVLHGDPAPPKRRTPPIFGPCLLWGWWRSALVCPDGVAPSSMVGVFASANLPLHHKVQKFCSGTD